MKNFIANAVALILLSYLPLSFAEDIKLGSSQALSGPSQFLGQQMKLGLDLYFNKLNASGGLNGRNIKLIVLDDKYEPSQAGENVNKLIKEDKVLVIVGNLGTPTAVVSSPIATNLKTLFFGAVTGGSILRKVPADPYIFNMRASYAEETDAIIKGLLAKGIKPEEIAFFTQNDSFGDDGYNGSIKALTQRGFTNLNLAHGRYTRNTLDVEDGLGIILSSKVEPKAIIMVGLAGPCAKFIKLAKEDFPKAYYIALSFVGAENLMEQLKDKTSNVIITQVLPVHDSNTELAKSYQADLKILGATPTMTSFEGYAVARLISEALKKATDLNSSDSIVAALENFKNVDIGIGSLISYDKTKHEGIQQVWPSFIKDGSLKSGTWEEILANN